MFKKIFLVLFILCLASPVFAGDIVGQAGVSVTEQYNQVEKSNVVSNKEIGLWDIRHYDKDGTLIWEQLNAHNALADEGEQQMLSCYLQATSCPTTFYVRLSDNSSTCSIAETDNIATAGAGEPSGSGYAAQEIPRTAVGWPTLALDSGDYMATSTEETFLADGGAWPTVYCAFLATSSDATGKLVAYVALSAGRTLADGESLKITLKMKQQ